MAIILAFNQEFENAFLIINWAVVRLCTGKGSEWDIRLGKSHIVRGCINFGE